MAITHVCLQCGRDLARVRAFREPHYGLNLVRCPNCHAPSVRRRHPVLAGWRAFRRLDFVATVVALKVVLGLVLTFFIAFAAIFAIVLMSELRRPEPLPPGATSLIAIFYIVLPALLGAYLSAAFAHIARWKMWLGWLSWMALVLAIVSLHGPMDPQFDPRPQDPGDLPMWRWVWEGFRRIALPGIAAVILMLIAALPGILIGRLLMRLVEALARAKSRWRHRRLRLAGAASV